MKKKINIKRRKETQNVFRMNKRSRSGNSPKPSHWITHVCTMTIHLDKQKYIYQLRKANTFG